jgi:hypothetical protein
LARRVVTALVFPPPSLGLWTVPNHTPQPAWNSKVPDQSSGKTGGEGQKDSTVASCRKASKAQGQEPDVLNPPFGRFLQGQ